MLYIDLGRNPAVLEHIDEYVVNEAERQLRESYGFDVHDSLFAEKVHQAALERFDRSPSGTLKDIDDVAYRKERVRYLENLVARRGPHLQLCLDYIHTALRRQVVIFLDNIDQRL